MYNVESNKKIGTYLSEKIKEKGYNKIRPFCKAGLKLIGKDCTDSGEVQREYNRLTQILYGNKRVQLDDIPWLCELLDISCEELLSAGKVHAPLAARQTNYSTALSNDRNDWERFVKHVDSPIQHPDEYGKNAIDYALEHDNYEFLKFLMNEGYIWFDDGNPDDYVLTFGAGTSIESICPVDWNDRLTSQMYQDEFRKKLIKMAFKHKDLNTLKELRARDCPKFYYCLRDVWSNDLHLDEEYDEELVNMIAKSSNKVIEYFVEPFTVRDRIQYKDGVSRNYTMTFPYMSELLDALIKYKSKYAEFALRTCIEHSEETYKKLKECFEDFAKNGIKGLSYKADDDWEKQYKSQQFGFWLSTYYRFCPKDHIVSFSNGYMPHAYITNIAEVKESSEDPIIKGLSKQLNDLYKKISSFEEEVRSEEYAKKYL